MEEFQVVSWWGKGNSAENFFLRPLSQANTIHVCPLHVPLVKESSKQRASETISLSLLLQSLC